MAKRYKQYFAASVATGLPFVFGLSYGWSSAIEAQITPNENLTCSYEFCVDKSEIPWIAALTLIGNVISGMYGGSLMAKIGRKRGVLFCLFLCLCSWLLLTLASVNWMFHVGRLLNGLGCGAGVAIATIYVGEVAESQIRGLLLGFLQIFACSGILTSYVLGYLFLTTTQSIISTVIVAVCMAAVLFIPESPYYYVCKNKHKSAEASLKWLRGKRFDTTKEIHEIMEFQKCQKPKGIKSIFKEKANIKAITIIFGIFAGVELSGQNGVLNFTARIFKAAKVNIDPNLATIYVGIFMVLGVVLAAFLMDRVGRRPLLIFSYASMCISFVVMGTYFELESSHPDITQSLGILPVIVLCFYIFTSSIGCSSVAFVMLGEIFAQNIKDVAASFTLTFDNILGVVVVLLFPLLDEAIGFHWVFFIFAIFNGLVLFFVFFFVPETKGKSFLEIQNLLVSGKLK